MQEPRCIAIDGPAGSGKSTIGEQLAQRLGYLYIDTGAMYRAVAWLALQRGIDINDGPALEQLAQDAEIVINRPDIDDGRQYTVTVRGQDVTWDIRSTPVTRAVSPVSAHPEVRAILIAQQRAMAQQGHVVMVGRDIGSVVLPDAELKIYLTASLEERARRRYAELVARLGEANPTLPSMEEVLKDIARRDEIDRDNMQPAKDAILIPTDHLSIPQVLEVINSYLGGAGGEAPLPEHGVSPSPSYSDSPHQAASEPGGAGGEATLPGHGVSPSPSYSDSPPQAASERRAKPEKNLYEPYSTPRIGWEAIRWLARLLFFTFLSVRLKGRENVPSKGPFIIASNHLSWTDVPLVPAYLPGKAIYMAKEEAFYSKVGWLVRFLGAFPVKRGEGDRQAIRAADEQLKAGKVLVIFPEGTRSRTHKMAKAHAGLGMIALRSSVPVVPVAVWGSENFLKKFRPRVTITYGEPMILKPKGRKIAREDIDEATDQVMRKIASMLPPEYRGIYGED